VVTVSFAVRSTAGQAWNGPPPPANADFNLAGGKLTLALLWGIYS